MEERDVVIIGGGPAGYAAAIRVSQLGGKATLVENETLGGTCLNRGCIPTRSLARAAELFDMGKDANDYGITYNDISIDFAKMMARKETVVKTLVAGVKLLLNANKVELVEGIGRFLSPSQIEVSLKDKTKKTLRARKVIMAAGSRCKDMPVQNGGTRVINTTQALSLAELPKSLLVVGGGFIGVTLATIFSKLGATASIVEESSRILPQIDSEIVAILEKELKSSRIRTYTDARIVGIKDDNGELHVDINGKGQPVTVSTQYVLMAEARESNIGELRLEKAGIQLNDKAGVVVNKKMETNISGILAAGDVTMEHMWTPVAYVEGITAADNAMGLNKEVDYSAVPYWISTVPEMSAVGMTEEEAIEKGYTVNVGRFPFAANGMATILGQRTGMVKIIVDERYHQILGVHIVGPGATDLIAGAALAIRLDVTPEDIGATLHAHPSLSEAIWEAARDVNGEAIHFLTQRR
ncbi:MAG: dihydrolipoyl dehydrogenase [Syntrophorhabdaceae bacterium]|nr:dihydrolipoyl dehydrogenase [Syntrophorhabdaceae bacterium]MDD5242844.1 dihydrolipoyl dehydrogenase [Syntrophorhabdaceae bacterium]